MSANLLLVDLAGIHFPRCFTNAAGTLNPALLEQTDLPEHLGGLVLKTSTLESRPGNDSPRTVLLPGIGMLNSIGLQNPGIQQVLNEEAPALRPYNLPVILSIAAHRIEEFGQLGALIANHPNRDAIDAVEVNLSCPNVEQGGQLFGSCPASVRESLRALRENLPHTPLFAKLTPNVTDIVSIAGAALEGGATGLTAINTVTGVAIDVRRKQPALPRVSAGYSGPGIKPIALHAVWQLHKHFPEVPIIGTGGILCGMDILEFILAGASLVQVGSGSFREPLLYKGIIQDLTAYAEEEGVYRLGDLRGLAHPR